MRDSAESGSIAKHCILFLVSHSSAGGAQELWANLALEFTERGYPVRLMALYPYRDVVRETSPLLPWSYVVQRRPTGPLAQALMFKALVDLFREEPPDVVFTAMPAANVLAPLAARAAGAATRVIISHHSPAQTYNRYLNLADGLVGCLTNVPIVISVSHAVATSLDGKPRSYGAKRRTVRNALPRHVEAQLASLAARRRPRSAANRRVVATGRLAPQKNTAALIRAAEHLSDVEICIVGSGSEDSLLRALAQDLNVTDRVHFMGHRPREEALRLLATGDVFVQPSLFEGHSLALIEAAKLGLPLIVSNVPTQVEGVTSGDGTRCGLIVEPVDHLALARSIQHLMDDEAAYGLWSDRAQMLAAESSFEAMMGAYEELVA